MKEDIMRLTRRTVLTAGAAAAAAAAAPGIFAQQSNKTVTGKFYERGPVRIYYEEIGSGFPLLLIPGGGLNSTIAALAQPVGWRPEMLDPKYSGRFWTTWGATLIAKRPEITLETTVRFVRKMFETSPDFVFTVTRDFVRSCQNPVLILPDEVPAHPYAVAMECAMLAPNAEVSMFPWKQPKERIPLAVRQIRSFLRAHRPA